MSTLSYSKHSQIKCRNKDIFVTALNETQTVKPLKATYCWFLLS